MTKLVSCFGRGEKPYREKGKGEKKRKKMEEPRSRPTRYGTLDFCMETTLGMDFVWITWNFKALYG